MRTCRGDRFHSKQGEEISSPKSILKFRDLEFDLGISSSKGILEELNVIYGCLSLIGDVDNLNWSIELEYLGFSLNFWPNFMEWFGDLNCWGS